MMDYPEKPVFNLIRNRFGGTGYKVRVVGSQDFAPYIVVKYKQDRVCKILFDGILFDRVMVYRYFDTNDTLVYQEPTLVAMIADPEFSTKVLVHVRVLRRRQRRNECLQRKFDEERRLEDLRLEDERVERCRKFEEDEFEAKLVEDGGGGYVCGCVDPEVSLSGCCLGCGRLVEGFDFGDG